MQKVEIAHNPYKVETVIRIGGREPEQNSQLTQHMGRLFQEWVDRMPLMIADECNDNEIEIIFHGTELDYIDLKEACRAADGVSASVIKWIPAKEAGAKEDDIREVFKMAQELPFEEIRSESVKNAFECAFDDKLEVNVIATMSAGKSTLINSLLGRKLMPSKNGACTATITRIQAENGSRHFIAKVYDKALDLLHLPKVKRNRFRAEVYDKDCELIETTERLDYDTMVRWNSNDDVSEIHAEGPIPFVEGAETKLILIDTPGIDNALNPEHGKVTAKALAESSKMLLLFVMNGSKLHDDSQDAFLRRVADSMKVGGKQARERFMFIINKLDAYDEDDDNIADETLKKTVEYLERMGIENPNIFPCAALPALQVREFREEQDEKKRAKLEKKLDAVAQHLIEQEQLHLEKYANLPRACRETINSELAEAEEADDIYGQALVHSGIRCVEEAIKMYVTKYSRPQKIKNVVSTLTSSLEAAEAFGKTQQSITSNEDELARIHAQIEILEKKLASGDENRAFKARVDALELGGDLSSSLKSLYTYVQKDLITFFDDCGEHMEYSEARQYIASFARMANEKQNEFYGIAETLLDEQIKQQGERLVEEYVKKLTALSDEMSDAGLEIDLRSLSKVSLGYIDTNDVISDSKSVIYEEHDERRSRTVTKRSSGWNRFFSPSRWFNPEYAELEHYTVHITEEISFVSKMKFVDSLVSPIEIKLNEARDSVIRFGAEKSLEIKAYFQRRFDEVDEMLRRKAEEMKQATASKESAAEALEKAKALLASLEEIKAKLNSILEI